MIVYIVEHNGVIEGVFSTKVKASNAIGCYGLKRYDWIDYRVIARQLDCVFKDEQTEYE